MFNETHFINPVQTNSLEKYALQNGTVRLDHNMLSSARCGDHVFDYDSSTLIFRLDNDPSCILDITLKNSLYYTVKYDINLLTFVNNNGP